MSVAVHRRSFLLDERQLGLPVEAPRDRRVEGPRRDPVAAKATTPATTTPASAPTPSFRRDPRAGIDARRRHGNDLGAQLLRTRLDDQLRAAAFPGGKLPVPPRPVAGSTRPGGEPFQPPTAEALEALRASVDASGDLKALDAVDNFRATLPPEQQAEYDRQLAALRADPRITFDYQDGSTRSAADEDLARRGILAATFGNPQLLESTIGGSTAPDGKVHVYVFPTSFDLDPFYPGATGQAPGLATQDGGIAIAQDFFHEAVRQGDNPFVHEFGHLTQRTGEHDDTNQGYPGDFPFAEGVQAELESPGFQAFLVDRFFGGVPQDHLVHTGQEGWPTLLNLYRQFPEQLKANSPKIYQAMSEYYGFDPIAGKSTPPVQLNGRGSLDQAVPTVRDYFGQIAGDDGKIHEEQLRAALADPSLPPEVHAAVAYLLSSPAAMHALDVGSGRDAGRIDGEIAWNDAWKLAQRLEGAPIGSGPTRGVVGKIDTDAEAQAVLTRYGVLADTAAGRGRADGHVSDGDLRALLADPGTPPELRAAAQYLLS